MKFSPTTASLSILFASAALLSTGLMPSASATDKPTQQAISPAQGASNSNADEVPNPSRFEFRIMNGSRSTHAPYIYESFRVMGNTAPDDFARALPRNGVTKQLQARKESPLGYRDLRVSGTGAIWVKIEQQHSDDDPTDYLVTDRFTGGLRADGTPVLRIEKMDSGKYVDLEPGQSSTTEHDMTWFDPGLTKPMKVTVTCNRVWQTPDGGPVITWFDVNVTPPS